MRLHHLVIYDNPKKPHAPRHKRFITKTDKRGKITVEWVSE